MKLQIQLSSCTRFDISVSTTSWQNKRIKNNPETRKNDRRHNEKKWIQVKYIIRRRMHVLGCINSIFEFWCEYIYLIFTGDWNGIAYRCCDWRIRDLILAAGASPPSPHVPGPLALTCQFPSAVIHGDRCLIIDYFC